jgi:hypothetical protein
MHPLVSSRMVGCLAIGTVACLAACATAAAPLPPVATQTLAGTPSPPESMSPSATSSPTSSVPAGWTSYTSAIQHVGFYLPASWKVRCDNRTDATWLLVDPVGRYPTCPLGDGQVGIFVESGTGTAPPTGFSLISTQKSLFSNVQTTRVTVNGIDGRRFSADQTAGQGSGSRQVEYDVATGGRTYYVLAIVEISGVRTATAAQVDQFVQTFTFGA